MDLSDEQLVKRVDNKNYLDEDLIELKTALHLPYYTTSGDYERIDGEIELAGVHYNYVKRKVSNDTLYLMCLPNETKTKLSGSLLEFTAHTVDVPGNDKSGIPVLKKLNILTDYCYTNSEYNIVAPEPGKTKETNSFASGLLTISLSIIYPPPKAAI